MAVDYLEAVFWDGSTSSTHVIREISCDGASVDTRFSWCEGTLIRLNIRRTADSVEESASSEGRMLDPPAEDPLPEGQSPDPAGLQATVSQNGHSADGGAAAGSSRAEVVAEGEIHSNVWSRVVRRHEKGFCLEFLFYYRSERESFRKFLQRNEVRSKDEQLENKKKGWQRAGAG
jgi:hypothetical protein